MASRGILNAITTTLLNQPTLLSLPSSTTPLTPPPSPTYDEYPPSTMGKLLSEILSIFHDLASYTPQCVQDAVRGYVRDKSQAEMCFLCTIVIVVVVFVIILPALEVVFLRVEEDKISGSSEEEEEILRYYYFTQRMEEEEEESVEKNHQVSTTTTMRVYSPGKGVVQMSMEELIRECSGSSCSGSSTGSGSMETIYEEEAEHEEEEYNCSSPTSSPPATPTPEMLNGLSRMVDEGLKRRLFHEEEMRPPLSSSLDHAPQ